MPLDYMPEESSLSLAPMHEPEALSLFAEEEELETTRETASVAILVARARVTIRRQRRRYLAHAAMGQALFMVPFYLLFSNWFPAIAFAWKFVLVLVPISLWAMITNKWTSGPPSGEMDILIGRGGIRAISPLLDSLRMNDCIAERKAVYTALTTLLPLLKASDAHLLTPANRRMLVSFCNPFLTPFG